MKRKQLTVKRAKVAGMCFGVRDALARVETLALTEPVTILGHLVHNPVVQQKLETLGVRQWGAGQSQELKSDADYVITAHGVSDKQRRAWQSQGLHLYDGTCPLVHRAHAQLRELVRLGYHPVVIGQSTHVEVKGLIGDYPQAHVLLAFAEIAGLPPEVPLGIVAQTTQPIRLVLELVQEIRRARKNQRIEFVDTVCQPTKQRQEALLELCREVELVIIVGGAYSNNTRQLLATARACGRLAYQVECAAELKDEWFEEVETVGLTAGTSTLDETLVEVEQRILSIELISLETA